MKIVVLGSGRVGNAMVRDLATENEWEITAVDYSQDSLDRLTEWGSNLQPIEYGVVEVINPTATAAVAMTDPITVPGVDQ